MRGIKKLIIGGVLAVGVIVGVYGTFTKTEAGECGSNSIIKCGVSSLSDLRKKYNDNYTKGTKTVYSYMGISSSTINDATVKSGYVTKSGDVVVSGKTVATSAVSTGHSYVSGSTKHSINGITFYTRKPSASFKSSQLSAYVFFDDNGRFIGAVLKVCGNAISGKPTQPKPVYTCDMLSADKKTAPLSNNSFTYTTKTSAKYGAKNSAYIYDFGDGTTQTVNSTSTSNSVSHSYTKAGTYTVKVTAQFTVNGETKSSSTTACQTTVTVTDDSKPGVSIDKKVDGVEEKEVTVNGEFKYGLVVKNTGSVALKNVVVTDTEPTNVDFISSSVGSITNGVFTYTIPSLAVDESVTIHITAKVTQSTSGKIVNTACVNAPEVPGEKDDCDDANVVVKPEDKPGVSIDKKVDGVEEKEVTVNGEFKYGLVVKNTGSVALKNVVVTDTEPTNVDFISSSVGSITNGVFTYTIPSLAVDESVTIHITAKVTQSTSEKIVNTACVNAPEVPGEKDDCDDANVVVKVPQVKRCDTTTDTIVNIPESEANDPRYTDDLEKCDKIVRCDTKTGNVVTIPKNDDDDDRYVDEDDDACKVDVCDPNTGNIIKVNKENKDKYEDKNSKNCGKVRVCNPSTGEIISVDKKDADNYDDANSSSCDDEPVETAVDTPTPTTPAELPRTGLSGAIGSIIGLGSIAAASYYYIASRRS